MARVEFDNALGIQSVSGAISRHRCSDGTVRVTFCTKKGRIYMRDYKRSTPLSENEKVSRAKFARIASEVARRIRNGDHRLKSIIWKEVKAELEDEKKA